MECGHFKEDESGDFYIKDGCSFCEERLNGIIEKEVGNENIERKDRDGKEL